MATRTGQAELVFAAAGASRTSAQDARSSDGLVAYAAGQVVALFQSADQHHRGIQQTLPGHQGDVSALKFARDGSGSANKHNNVFVSGDSKGVACVWRETEGKWSTLAVLSGHTGSVASVAALELPEESGAAGKLLVFTGGSDSVIQVWEVSLDGAAELKQKIDLKGKIPLEIALSYLPSSSSLVLAVGATEARIQLYSSPSASNPSFRKSLSLEGHTDWIRCLSFITPVPASDPSASTSSSSYDVAPGEVLLASGSQDNYIRLWRFSTVPSSDNAAPSAPSASAPTGLDALDELDKTLAEAEAAAGGTTEDGELRVKAHDFTVEGAGTFSCSSEAVLLGHDAWVTGLNWAPLPSSSSSSPSSSTSSPPPLRLLSTSADRSLILWTPLPAGAPLASSSALSAYTQSSPHSSFVWTSTRRFGEFTSQTNLGFFGALWGKEGRSVLASGWGGSWHVWRDVAGDGEGEWEPQGAPTGHLGAVRQVEWEPEGEYLLSCAADMSTRLWAPWRRTGEDGKEVETWHELGRPQIHGYTLSSVAFTTPNGRLQFVSGADEKIVRVFDAPKVFLSTLRTLNGVDAGSEAERPMAANVPPLGLSNRAIATAADAENLPPASNDPFEAVTAVDFRVAPHPPLEEQLLGSTLWPETEKLYGHAFELVSVASAHSTPLIASACKSTVAEHAVIRLHDARTWRPVGDVLQGHALTVTKLAFSPGLEEATRDRWLLSVGRDRTWRLHERDEAKGAGFYRPLADAKPHARIIWDACWAADASFFATASRDKTVKIWSLAPSPADSSSWTCAATLKFPEAATSVAATVWNERHVLAVGLENGEVRMYTAAQGGLGTWEERVVLDSTIAHVLTVSSLAFCPKKDLPAGIVRLASGSEDRSVRVFDLSLP
ncbi:hypothetical protein JCM10207_006046 [Rhodosporidiobolus poonsookiae]